MRILLVTPSADADAPGNRVTADRWAGFLRELGHEAEVRGAYPPGDVAGGAASPDTGRPPDLLVALHARKSRTSALRFDEERTAAGRRRAARGSGARSRNGEGGRSRTPRLVVALTGTDLYRDLEDPDGPAWDAVRRADRLVVLQERGPEPLPAPLRQKTRVIFQSVPELWEEEPGGRGDGGGNGGSGRDGGRDEEGARGEDERRGTGRRGRPVTRVCMLAHLRPVKDPLLAAEAARHLPAESRIRIDHYGAAYSDGMARRARDAARDSSRYRWHGEVPRAEALRRLAESDLMLLTSRREGAGNATSEAITARVPILCTRVAGLVGMVGEGYPGLFEPGDARGLARLLRRTEVDADFAARLRCHIGERRPLLDPDRERAAWAELLRELDLTRQ